MAASPRSATPTRTLPDYGRDRSLRPRGRAAIRRQGRLTNVTDVAGLSNAFQYDSRSWVTNLTTPYGNTTFEHVDNGFTKRRRCHQRRRRPRRPRR